MLTGPWSCTDGLWKDLFRDSSVMHLVTSHSDHAFLLVKLDIDHEARHGHGVRKRKAIRFERFRTDVDGCNKAVDDAWGLPVGGNAVDHFFGRLSHTTSALSKWSYKGVGSIQR